MMLLLIIVLLIVVLGGGGYGWRAGYVGYNPIGLILFVVVILLLFGMLGGPRFGLWHY